MTYRDRVVRCPRCSVELARADARDRWSCARCRGVFATTEDVIQALLEIAPDLLPAEGARSISTPLRASRGPALACPICAATLSPVFLGGVELDRCFVDEVFWFDVREHDAVLATAAAQHAERTRPWLARYLRDLFA